MPVLDPKENESFSPGTLELSYVPGPGKLLVFVKSVLFELPILYFGAVIFGLLDS